MNKLPATEGQNQDIVTNIYMKFLFLNMKNLYQKAFVPQITAFSPRIVDQYKKIYTESIEKSSLYLSVILDAS